MGAGADRELHAPVELPRIREAGLGEDDRELVAAHPAGDVRAPDDRLQSLGHAGEDGVSGQMPDAVVDRLEVVDVEEDERELAGSRAAARSLCSPSVCASDSRKSCATAA